MDRASRRVTFAEEPSIHLLEETDYSSERAIAQLAQMDDAERREVLKAAHRARRAQRNATATAATTTTRTEERPVVSNQTTTSASNLPKVILKTPVLQGDTTLIKPRRVFIKLKLKSKGANGFYHYLLGEFLPVLDIILQGDHAADPVFLVWPKKQTLKYIKKISNTSIHYIFRCKYAIILRYI